MRVRQKEARWLRARPRRRSPPHAPLLTARLRWQSFEKREALLNETAEGGESGNGGASSSGATTSSGEPLDARSLSAQVVVAK